MRHLYITDKNKQIWLKEALQNGICVSVINGLYDREGRNQVCIQQAGKPGVITISAKVAGRGQDISLPHESINLGGLHVIIAECSDILRHDRQAEGRAGRFDEIGESTRFISLEDDLIKYFGGFKLKNIIW